MPHRRLPASKDSRSLAQPAASPVEFEPLERRELLSGGLPTILQAEADNRGMAVMTASCDLISNSVNPTSVRVFTAGADGLLGTADDQLQSRDVSYDSATRQIRVNANLPPNSRYRIALDSSLIRGTNNQLLDGEFVGASRESGDGVAGGDYEFFTRIPVGEEIMRMSTTSGTILIRMLRSQAPLSVQNFLNYANRGVYDTTFFHRSVDNFVIQAGGFTANSSFSSIPTDPPVMNEFGRSNTRGTIAYAKFGSDPNSATSQFFFNLGNNSANLDNQNGGFTVFAEVLDSSGLSVMDALGAFMQVNASSANSAFNEIPVIDADQFNANGQLRVSDLVGFSRVALLMDVSADANQQPPLQGSVDIVSPRGQAIVRLYDMNGSGNLNLTDFVSVRFGSGNSISQIRVLEPPVGVRIGIQILNASSVGSIVDARTSAATDVAFLVSDSAVGSVKLTQRISGSNLNGFVFPGGFALPDDIDGDGVASDDTAIYFPVGFVSTLDARAGLSGDVVLPGGLGSAKARGDITNSDFVIGLPASGTANTSFSFANVQDSQIRATGGVRSITAAQWLDSGNSQETIQAASLGKLSIRGSSGDFEAGLNLTGDQNVFRTLGSAKISGGLFRSDWVIRGNSGAINVRGDISQWSLDVDGDGSSIRAQALNSVEVVFAGRFNSIRANEWNGGRFEADFANSISIAGNFEADVLLNNTDQQRVALKTLNVKGDFLGGDFTVTRGEASSLLVRGDVRDLNVSLPNGAIPNISLGQVRDSSLSIFGAVRSLRAVRWDGGTIGAAAFDAITMTGDPRRGISGDAFVTETRSDRIGALSLSNGGSYSGNLFAGQALNIQIAGDARNGVFSIGSGSLGTSVVVENLRVFGTMDTIEFRTGNSVGTISVGAMNNSSITVGSTNTVFLPDTGAGINTASTISVFRVEGLSDQLFSMFNSSVVAGRITAGFVTEPQTDNFGRPFGIAVQTIGNIGVRIGNQLTTLHANSPARAFGDFQIRTGFTIPT